MIKKVAGFHSFDLTFFFRAERGELFRSGLGTKLTQKPFEATVELVYVRCKDGARAEAVRGRGRRVLRMAGGVARSLLKNVELFIVIVMTQDVIVGSWFCSWMKLVGTFW